LTKQEVEELDSLTANVIPPLWIPMEGPQTKALDSEADITFYGGAAGGGKTDLAIGLALTKHKKSIIFRREATQLTGVIDRMTEIIGNREGYNGQEKIWRLDGRQVEFGSMPHPGDETKYQGRPHDLIVYDEIPHFLESMVRFTMGWLRTTEEGQRCRVVFTGNPPTDSQGDWVIPFFGPWLDEKHPNPAKPGELRWFAVIDGEDIEVDSQEQIKHKGQLITPKSRTFIPSLVTDNQYLVNTDYIATLQALPEPLRSQMLYGDFSAGRTDGEWQVIPTRWVDQAMERWTEQPPEQYQRMEAMGVDPNRGGQDKMILSPRHGPWFARQISYTGAEVPDGQTGASLVIKNLTHGAVPLVDMIGYGSSCYDHLTTFGVEAIALNGSKSDARRDISDQLNFPNLRSYWIWKMRDLLDPRNGYNLMLPVDAELKADLCSYEYKMTARGMQIRSKQEMKERLGRSPDKGDSLIYAIAERVDRVAYEDHYEDKTRFEGRSAVTGY